MTGVSSSQTPPTPQPLDNALPITWRAYIRNRPLVLAAAGLALGGERTSLQQVVFSRPPGAQGAAIRGVLVKTGCAGGSW